MSAVSGFFDGFVGGACRPSAGILPAAVALSALLSGCSVGNIGLLGAQVADFNGGQSVEVHALGLHLRGRSDDPGLSLGYSRRSYYFANTGALAPGWHFFRIPMPEVEAVALHRRSLGLDLTTADPEAGLVIGYEQVIVQARVPDSASVVLEYASEQRNPVRYVQCGSTTSCDSIKLH